MKIINFFKQLFNTTPISTVKEEQDAPLLVTGGTTRKGNITIDSAESIAQLKTVTHLDGDIKFINTPDGLDFSTLDTLKKVTGSIIFSETGLTHIAGLNALTTIGKNLQIGRSVYLDDDKNEICFELEEINAFSALKTIGGRLIIGSNFDLLRINGFTSLESVGEMLHVVFNNSLIELTGFTALKKVGGDLVIGDNETITKLPKFPELKNVQKDLIVSENKSLTEVTGFSKLESVGSDCSIDSNENITVISGFQSLSSIGQWLWVKRNERLEKVSGFEKLSAVNDFSISENPNLKSVIGFDLLQSIKDSISSND